MRTAQIFLLLAGLMGAAIAEVPNNPEPCTEWVCVSTANVTKVTVGGPTKLKINEEGTWTATATTVAGKQVCVATGAERECPVTAVKWTMAAGDRSSHTNTITRSWATPGTYVVVATGEPISDCCPGSGTSGSLDVEVVGCEESPARTAFGVDLAGLIGDELTDLKSFMENVPFIKQFDLAVFGEIQGEKYEKCCSPTDTAPTPAWSVSGSGGVRGTMAIYAPGLGGRRPVYYRVPRWLVFGSTAVFYGEIGGGVFGGASGEGSATVTWKKECGECLEVVIAGILKGFVGINVQLKGELIYGDGSKYGCEAEAAAYAELGARYGLSGKFFDCRKPLDITGCYTGASFNVEVTAFCHGYDYGLKISEEFDLWEGTCE